MPETDPNRPPAKTIWQSVKAALKSVGRVTRLPIDKLQAALSRASRPM